MPVIPYHITDWTQAPVQQHAGESGTAWSKTHNVGGLRMRQVKYSANYKANHWCSAGHILYCMEGEFTSELSDGRKFTLAAGMSYIVSNGASAHRSTSERGATLLIIDGNFLDGDHKFPANPWKM